MDTPTTTMDVLPPDETPGETPSLDSFARNFCTASIQRTANGRYLLDIECDLHTTRGRAAFNKQADLTDIINSIRARVTDPDSALHGEHISGPLLYAVGGIADQAAALLFREVAPLLAYSTPWGQFVRAAKTVSDARKGDRTARAKVVEVRQAAADGNEAARKLSALMTRIQTILDENKASVTSGHDPYVIDAKAVDELDVSGERLDELDIGRVLSIPYRDPIEAITDGSPGAGLTFRALFAKGARAPGLRKRE